MGRQADPRRSRVMQALYEGAEIKHVVFETGLTEQVLYRWLSFMGLRKRYITDDEYKDVLSARKGRKAQAA